MPPHPSYSRSSPPHSVLAQAVVREGPDTQREACRAFRVSSLPRATLRRQPAAVVHPGGPGDGRAMVSPADRGQLPDCSRHGNEATLVTRLRPRERERHTQGYTSWPPPMPCGLLRDRWRVDAHDAAGAYYTRERAVCIEAERRRIRRERAVFAANGFCENPAEGSGERSAQTSGRPTGDRGAT